MGKRQSCVTLLGAATKLPVAPLPVGEDGGGDAPSPPVSPIVRCRASTAGSFSEATRGSAQYGLSDESALSSGGSSRERDSMDSANPGSNTLPALMTQSSFPLHAALKVGDGELAGALIAQGADLTEADVLLGATPLHYASLCGDRDLASVILGGLRGCADAERRRMLVARAECGGTPLHWALQKGHVKCALTLIAAGSNLDDRDDLGYTPLQIASRRGLADVVAEMVRRGADVRAEGPRRGETALELAVASQHSSVVALLVSADKGGGSRHHGAGRPAARATRPFATPRVAPIRERRRGVRGGAANEPAVRIATRVL